MFKVKKKKKKIKIKIIFLNNLELYYYYIDVIGNNIIFMVYKCRIYKIW